MKLSLTILQNNEPDARARFCCPLPDCSDKPVDRSHRSLQVDLTTGVATCHRCHFCGILSEYATPRKSSRTRRSKSQLEGMFSGR